MFWLRYEEDILTVTNGALVEVQSLTITVSDRRIFLSSQSYLGSQDKSLHHIVQNPQRSSKSRANSTPTPGRRVRFSKDMIFALGCGRRDLGCKLLNLRCNVAMAHQSRKISCASGLRVVVRAIVLNIGIGVAFHGCQSRDAHWRSSKVNTSRDDIIRGDIPTDLFLPFDLGGIVRCSCPTASVCNRIGVNEDCRSCQLVNENFSWGQSFLLTVWLVTQLNGVQVSHFALGQLGGGDGVRNVVKTTIQSQDHGSTVICGHRNERWSKGEGIGRITGAGDRVIDSFCQGGIVGCSVP